MNNPPEKKITVIPAAKKRFADYKTPQDRKRRVAAYARVSTELEEQQSSYAAQIDYYTGYIKDHPDWELAGIYTDEGISATNTRHREGFNKMINDALSGKIDLIITKSVSRFARNTVDSLTAVRSLKEAGIEVYFEKENIHTLDSKGELLITIMSSLAQEESRSISENVTWGHRKRFADGKVSLAYSRFLGYDKGENGELIINEQEAKIVRQIYKLYLAGYTFHTIANKLTSENIKTPSGKDVWNQSTIRNILTNEKYKGDALLQKSYTSDFLTKKKKRNKGEIPQYYIENNHQPIIDPPTFELVQLERLRRAVNCSENGSRYSGVGIFSSRIKCGECGCWYGAKVWHSNTKYRKIVYQCNGKYRPSKTCCTPHLYEEDIKIRFINAVNSPDMKNYMKTLKNIKTPVTEFTEDLWSSVTDYIVVFSDGKIRLYAKNSFQIEI